MKRFGYLISLLVASSMFFSGCGGSSTVIAEDTPQTITEAIDKIKAYAEDQTQPVPVLQDYVDAGIDGVTADNLEEINALVATLTPEDVDTAEKIQTVLDDNGLTIVDPEDTVAPVITVTGDNPVTVTLGETYTDAGATALDNVDGDITANIVTVNPVDTDTLGTYTVTYNVSDAATNAAVEVTRTVTVVEAVVDDNEAPVITLLGATPVTVTQGATYIDAGATATDNVDGDITANIATVNPVDADTLGTYIVTYNVSDAATNAAVEVTRTVEVVAVVVEDTTPPVITLLGTTPVTVTLGETYTDAGATALDNVDGNITANIATVNPIDTDTLGTYIVTYNVSDAATNAAVEVTRTVEVVAVVVEDTTPPVITLLGTTPVTVTLGETYTDAGATALDNVDGNITANIATVNPIDTDTLGTYIVTYNVSDAATNAAVEVTRTVEVVAVVAVGEANATNTTFSANLTTLPVYTETNITVTLRDSDGIALTQGGDIVTLKADKSSVHVYSGTTDNLDGTYTITVMLERDLLPGEEKKITYTAIVNAVESPFESGILITYTESILEIGDANVTTSLVDATTPVVANGTAITTITVTLKDSAGTSLTDSNGTVTMAGTGSSVITSVVDNLNGTYTCTATNETPETVTYTASLDGEVIIDTATVEFTDATLPDITNPDTTVVADPTEVVADGTTSTITVTLVDGTGSPTAGGETVTLTSSSTNSVPSVATDVGDGTYTFTASNTVAETVTYTAVLNGVPSTNSATVVFIAGAADATKSTVTASPAEVLNDGAAIATITVTLEDSNGNTITTADAYTVAMASDSTTAAISAVTANVDGTYTFTATNTVIETVTYTGALDGTSIAATAEVLFTDNPASIDPASYVGNTVVFTGVAGEFSFYQNNKFVKVNSVTRDFEFIGTWDAAAIYDDKGVLIEVTGVDSQVPIFHVTIVEGKDSGNPFALRGWAIRQKNADGIEFVYFRDPAVDEDVTPENPTLFSTFGYDLTALPAPQSHGAMGKWVIVDGKVVASNPTIGEIGTYTFDRSPDEIGAILTKTIGGNLDDVYVSDEFYQLRPSVILDDQRPVEVVGVELASEAVIGAKMMTINDKAFGPSAWYFEERGAVGEDPELAYVIAAGISIEGIPWGGKGDDGWNIAGTCVNIKIHYEGAVTSTKEGISFDADTPTTGTLLSKYTDVDCVSANFLGTTAAARFVDF